MIRQRQQIPGGTPGGMPQPMPGQMPGRPMQQPMFAQPQMNQFLPIYPGAENRSERQRLRDALTGGKQSRPMIEQYLASIPSPMAPANRGMPPMAPQYGMFDDYLSRMGGAGSPMGGGFAPPPLPPQQLDTSRLPFKGGRL